MNFLVRSCVVLFIGLNFLVFATAAVPSDRGLYKRNNGSVTAEVFDNLDLFEQFCAATYCNYAGPISGKLSCTLPWNNGTSCPRVESANTEVIAIFDNTGPSGLTGYVAHDHTRNLTVVAFRGTQNLRNYVADFYIPLSDTDLCPGPCQAHAGYWWSWSTSREEVFSAVRYATMLHPEYSLVVTGHSLGGAQATLCAADLRNHGYNAALYAYGCPRTSSPQLAEYISSQPGGNYRVTHLNDPVVVLPPSWDGYQHITPEYYIDSATNASAEVTNVLELQGIDNPLGSAGQPFYANFAPHTWYFGNTTACAPGTPAFKKRSWDRQYAKLKLDAGTGRRIQRRRGES